MSFAIQTWLDRSTRWLMVSLDIENVNVDLVLDTGAPASGLHQQLFGRLVAEGKLDARGVDWGVLRSLSSQGRPFPPLRVRVSPRATQLGVTGVIGLDFLSRFSEIHFDRTSMVLTLVQPE